MSWATSATVAVATLVCTAALTGCGSSTVGGLRNDEPAPPTVQARVTAKPLGTATTVVVPTPTMSAEVLRKAYWCDGWRIRLPIEPGRIVSATYSGGVWDVETDGMWELHDYGPPGLPVSGYPTKEPWQELEYIIDCHLKLDAESAAVLEAGGQVVTATPPGR